MKGLPISLLMEELSLKWEKDFIRELFGKRRETQEAERQCRDKPLCLLFKEKWLGNKKTSKLKERTEELIIDNRVTDYERILKLGITKIQFERRREKGIDVKLATDLIVGAIDGKYDEAVIVSSDSDLIPAIDWVRHRGRKKIEYVGFSIPDESDPKKSTEPLVSLIIKTDIKRILVKSDLQPFIIKSLFSK